MELLLINLQFKKYNKHFSIVAHTHTPTHKKYKERMGGCASEHQAWSVVGGDEDVPGQK